MNRHFPALRGVAILLVVVNHAVTLTLDGVREHGFPPVPGWERAILVGLRSLGLVAVPLFLFLSGSFAVYAMRGKPLIAGYRSVRLSLQHVLIPYLLWSIIFYLGIYILLDQTFALGEYVKFLFVGYPFNFVPLLVFFYLVAPLLLRLADRAPWVLLLGIALYQLLLFWVAISGEIGQMLPTWMAYLTPPGLGLSFGLWGIFFPMGVVFGLRDQAVKRAVRRAAPVLLVASFGLYLLVTLDVLGVVAAPLAGFLLPMVFIPLMPVLRRELIPGAQALESLGRNAYGLYLTNLLMITVVLTAALAVAPSLFRVPVVLAGLAGAAAIAAVSLAAAGLARSARPKLRLYVFG
jgi:surface polysaccharide O-acyltransferase-like enzyme